MGEAEKIAGKWVRNADLNPATNIMGRRWWARGDHEGIYYGQGTIPQDVSPDDLWWHFPNRETQPR